MVSGNRTTDCKSLLDRKNRFHGYITLKKFDLSDESANADLVNLKALVNNSLGKSLVEGDIWYLLAKPWFNQLKKYVGSDLQELAGRMDNTSILTSGNCLKKDLQEGIDYVLVPQECWKELDRTFGTCQLCPFSNLPSQGGLSNRDPCQGMTVSLQLRSTDWSLFLVSDPGQNLLSIDSSVALPLQWQLSMT